MNKEEAVRKLEYSKTAYQMLIDEKVDSGKLVGKDVKGEWKADTPLDEAYKSMIEALEMGIKAIKALEQEPCDNAVSRQDVLDLAKKGVLVSNGNYESVCKAINEIPSAEPKTEQFAKWVATEIFDDNWEYNKDAFDELACRKLAKLGIVRAKGDEWELVEPQERSDKT